MPFDAAGWLAGATRRLSPNRYQQPNPREIIVMHYTAGYDAGSAINHFLRPSAKASAHFVVEVDGTVIQMVSVNECAWHAGYGEYHDRPNVNRFSIGIEIVNPGYHFRRADGSFVNWERKPVSTAQLAPFPGMTEAKDPWVGSATASWPNFPDAQLDAVEDLTRELLGSYPSIVDIVGHRDVDGVRRLKVDPGPAFPMRRFRLLLDDRSADLPPSVAMRVATSGGTLNVRGGPGTSFETLDWGPLTNGTRVVRLEAHNEWYRVHRAGTPANEGWVYARYLVPD